MVGQAAVLLIAAFLIQNLAELRGGGPPVPRFLAQHDAAATARIRRRAMLMVSVLVPLLLFAAVMSGWDWLVLMLAAALAANALAQLGQSLWQRRVAPGTLPGILLMLPAAIWLIAALGPQPNRPLWLGAGVLAMVPLLFLVWFLAARGES